MNKDIIGLLYSDERISTRSINWIQTTALTLQEYISVTKTAAEKPTLDPGRGGETHKRFIAESWTKLKKVLNHYASDSIEDIAEDLNFQPILNNWSLTQG